MTKKLFTSYTAFLCMAMVMVGVTTVYASEVTGTLSSDTSSNAQTTGSISGTVSSGNGGSSSSGSRSSGSSSGSSPSRPAGSVSGVSTNNSLTPNFPNAGFAPEENYAEETVWSAIVTLLRNIVSF